MKKMCNGHQIFDGRTSVGMDKKKKVYANYKSDLASFS